MNKIVKITLLLSFFPILFFGQKKEVLPKAKFDEQDAQNRLAYGTATIKGTVVARDYNDRKSNLTGVKHTAPAGTVVVLFPMTDYFKAYLRLRQKYKMSLNYMPVLSTDAFRYRIETRVNQYGEFVFDRMKPGEYYIEAKFDYTGEGTGKKQVGQDHWYNGYGHYLYSSPVYQSYIYSYQSSSVEKAKVKVKKDGETINIRL